jgi:hypothetical protein
LIRSLTVAVPQAAEKLEAGNGTLTVREGMFRSGSAVGAH